MIFFFHLRWMLREGTCSRRIYKTVHLVLLYAFAHGFLEFTLSIALMNRCEGFKSILLWSIT